MLSKNIRFKNFSNKSKNLSVYKIFKNLKNNYLNEKIKILSTLSNNYKYNYNKIILLDWKNLPQANKMFGWKIHRIQNLH